MIKIGPHGHEAQGTPTVKTLQLRHIFGVNGPNTLMTNTQNVIMLALDRPC